MLKAKPTQKMLLFIDSDIFYHYKIDSANGIRYFWSVCVCGMNLGIKDTKTAIDQSSSNARFPASFRVNPTPSPASHL